MLRIWGRLSSINVRKVVLAVQWLGLPFERIDAGGEFGVVGTPAYRARNPNGLVPLVDDEGFLLWESNVIVRYLAARHAPGRLYPEALPARFDAERWMDWQQTTLNRAGREAFLQLVRTPAPQRRQDQVDASVAATEPLLDLLDAHLAGQAFMAGAAFTMADIPIACELHRWRGLPLAHRPRPHLDRWYAGVAGLPAARGVLDLALS
ncbi:glutathione S-transferase family protein [Ramlibacter tataouinensis]|uniref:Glutathione S-transferase (Glutathione S-alkyltransferase)-like protein n=1 Tax=Ramlibacter tataouinensis (strain ATCC BAA-407 / DSM 14655 / LMG 21543 / TTB310) TaxID=365046 RepID=F5XVN8_RAMTT|nr:glutathione S-transferase [Ramlibacter tataouinensis]AEG91614.1 glutathione S-transferase (glutathione S-alkyltransferase)-like protein [Ramlibacter tataouinensis TTB310]